MNALNYEIRSVGPQDLAAVSTWLRENTAGPEISLSGNAAWIAQVAKDVAGQIVGVAWMERSGSEGFFRSVIVAPGHRRKGLASLLMARCETSALVAGVTEAYLRTVGCAGFFIRIGYRELSRKVLPATFAARIESQGPDPEGARYLGKML